MILNLKVKWSPGSLAYCRSCTRINSSSKKDASLGKTRGKTGKIFVFNSKKRLRHKNFLYGLINFIHMDTTINFSGSTDWTCCYVFELLSCTVLLRWIIRPGARLQMRFNSGAILFSSDRPREIILAFLDIKASLALSINISVLERSKRERERIETLNQTIALSVLPYRWFKEWQT